MFISKTIYCLFTQHLIISLTNIELKIKGGDKMSYVELRFHKRDLIEVLRKGDKKALWELVLESVQNFMEKNI